jgi:D-alanyl-D-alanine carboxypeptidase
MLLDPWIKPALDYVPRWIEHQMRLTGQPGCALAVAQHGKVLLDLAFGHADLPQGLALTPRHRFRVASHSKTFTAAGVMKLREQGRLRLDDSAGSFVPGLHPQVAQATLGQLLSHTAGLVRDGTDAGQWFERRPFLDADELRADLAAAPTLAANTRFKYSNHGYGLAGLVIEAVTGERYVDWIAREIVAASGLQETQPDGPVPRGTPMARGHSALLPLERRVAVPGDNSTRALASATGFVSTAADLVRFFGSLAPEAKKSVLSAASRREMTRRQWRDPHSTLERWYGLGTLSGPLAGWEAVGHSGSFPGTITRTVCVPQHQLAVSVLTNAADGWSHVWLEGILHVLRAYSEGGAPSRRTAPWSGRWWNLWGAFDLLPMAGGKVLVANPAMPNPVMDASRVEVGPRGRAGAEGGTDPGRIVLANGFASHGEPARLVRDARGRARELWLGGSRLLPQGRVAQELEARYGRRR